MAEMFLGEGAVIYGTVSITGTAQGNPQIFGSDTSVNGNVSIQDNAQIYDGAVVTGNVTISGTVNIYGAGTVVGGSSIRQTTTAGTVSLNVKPGTKLVHLPQPTPTNIASSSQSPFAD